MSIAENPDQDECWLNCHLSGADWRLIFAGRCKFRISMAHGAISSWLWTLALFGSSFGLTFLLGIFLEELAPTHGLSKRQLFNLALMFAWTALLYLSWPWTARILIQFPELPFAHQLPQTVLERLTVIAISAAVLDFIQYWLHRALHASAILWALHALHHSDLEVDSTTGVRHNLLEPLFGAVVQTVFIVILGIVPIAVIVYSSLANAQAILSHSDIHLPPRLENACKYVVITSHIHRLHHMALPRTANRNFGVLFPWWDMLFGTYECPSGASPRGTFGIVV